MRNGSPFMLAWLRLATPAARTERCDQAALQSRAPASTASFSHSRYGDATARRKRPAFARISSPSPTQRKNKDLLAGARGFDPWHLDLQVPV